MANTIGTAYVQIVPSAQGITKSVTSLLDPAGSTAGKSMGSKVGSGLSSFFKSSAMVAVGNLAAKAFSAAASTITSSLSSAVSRVDTMSNYSNIMKGLGYSASDAKAQITKLSEGIEGLPTTLDGIVTIQQQFTALTGSMDEATKLSLALNNATLAGGQGAEVAASAMQQWYQVIANGTPDLQSWRIINAAMPAQLNQLAQSILGAEATSTDLFNAWKAGTVTTDQVKDALVTLNEEGGDGITAFSEQALTGTAGISTALQNMKTAVVKNVANILETLNGGEGGNNITSIFAGMKNTINAFGSAINNFLKEHTEAIYNIANAISTLLDPNAIYDPSTFQSLADGIMGILTDLLSKILALIPHILTAVGEILPQLLSLVVNCVTSVISALGQLLPQVVVAIVNVIPQLITGILECVASVVSALGQAMPQIISAILGMIPQVITGLIESIPLLINAALQLVSGLALGILEALPVLLETMPQVINSMVTGLISALPQILQAAAMVILALVDGIVQNLPSIVQSAIDIIYSLVGTLTNATNLFLILDAVLTIMWKIYEGISSNLPYIIEAALSIITSLASGLLQFLPQLIKAILQIMLAVAAAIISAIPSILESTAKIIWNLLSYLKNDAGPRLVNTIKNFPEKIKGIFTNLKNSAKTWGSDFMNAFINSIASKVSSLVSTVSGMAKKIRSYLHFSRPDEGPLRDYETWMPDMVEGLASSLKKRSSVLTDAVSDLAGDMVLAPSMSVGAFGEMSGSSSNTTVTMNIYGAEGQDVNALADIIEKRLTFNTRKAAAAW
jgi:trimeric autotransporter adhesin